MIDLWSNKKALRDVAEDATNAAKRAESRWLYGPPSSGRHLAFRRVAADQDVIAVEVVGADQLDGAFHVVTELTRALDRPIEPLVAASTATEMLAALRARGRLLGSLVAQRGNVLGLLLPLDWPSTEPDLDDDNPARQVRAVLDGLHSSGVAAIVISTPRAHHPWRGTADGVALSRPEVGSSAIQPDAVPALASAASAVARALDRAGIAVSPIDARVMIGLTALGCEANDLVHRPREALVQRLLESIVTKPTLSAAALRLVVARRALRPEWVSNLVEDGGERALLLHCIGYGDHEIRVPDVLRHSLEDRLGRSPDRTAAHADLAAYHAQMDGLSSPSTLGQAATRIWIDKLYHLAQGGAATETEWEAQDKLDRALYWERARYLSKVERRYADAAALYRECLARFGPDAYTHHYLGFNLDRAQAPIPDVGAHLRTAVALDDTNPWWNARLVTFLIAHGTLAEAQRAWEQAHRRIDPDGERMSSSPWLARHLHRWVIRSWLALGRVREAREVLDEIPARWLASTVELQELAQLVGDAEEAQQLGESVYPATVPVAERWQAPRATAAINGSGSSRTRWWPGYVLEHVGGEVVAVVADPATRTAYRVSYDDDVWRKISGQAPDDARGFIELAEYADGSQQVGFVPGVDSEPLAPELEQLARRARAWSAS